MAGINDFKAFAGGAGANVVSQAAYEALVSLLANGFSSGTAQSNQINKVWRQSTIMSAVLAQFIVDQTGSDALDDGTTATLLANLKLAVQPVASRTAHAGGTADAITATFPIAPTAFVDGLSYFVRAASANATTIPSFTPNSGVLAAKTIVKGNDVALVPGDIAGAGHWLELNFDTTLDKWVLQNPAGILGVGGVGSSDYIKIPFRDKTTGVRRDLIVQWGTINASNTADVTVTFPLAFPNAVFAVLAQHYGTGSTGNFTNSTVAGGSPLTSFLLSSFDAVTGNRLVNRIGWIAVGY